MDKQAAAAEQNKHYFTKVDLVCILKSKGVAEATVAGLIVSGAPAGAIACTGVGDGAALSCGEQPPADEIPLQTVRLAESLLLLNLQVDPSKSGVSSNSR